MAANGIDANVYPYFVGVFDTVAALFNPRMAVSLAFMFLAFDMTVSWLLLLIPDLPLFGKFLPFLGSFWLNFRAVIELTIAVSLAFYVYTHLKFDFGVPGYTLRQRLATMHRTELYQKFYDYTLNSNIPYAKHAISIDENRKDFRRVGWDPVKLIALRVMKTAIFSSNKCGFQAITLTSAAVMRKMNPVCRMQRFIGCLSLAPRFHIQLNLILTC